jgi:hypothetical protein
VEEGIGKRSSEDKTIMHHLEVSLAPCDHPMWIIWGRGRHHHALTAHGRGGGGVVPYSRLRVAPGPTCVTAAPIPPSRLKATLRPP